MSKFDLKGYKEKFDKVKSDKSRDFKKMQEDENVGGFNQLLSAYTDVVDEEKDKEYNLFHYGIVRNPETEKTIIGVKEDEEGNYTEFIVDHIDIDDVIGMVQSADEKFEELFDGISKDEIIQRIYNNEGFVAPIINAIFFTGNGGEEYNYEDEITMDKETLEEYLENDSYESNEIDNYEFSYDENGEIEDIEEKKSHADVMPESRDYRDIEDEFYFMNGYKVVFKDDKGNCRLFESKKNERLAKIYAENLAKDLKERNFDKDGSRVSIIAPYSIDEENVIKLDESVISLKEELAKRDGTGPHGKRNRKATEKCPMSEETKEEIENMREDEKLSYILNNTNIDSIIAYNNEENGELNSVVDKQTDFIIWSDQDESGYSYNIIQLYNNGDIYFSDNEDSEKEFIGNIYELESDLEEEEINEEVSDEYKEIYWKNRKILNEFEKYSSGILDKLDLDGLTYNEREEVVHTILSIDSKIFKIKEVFNHNFFGE